MEKPITDEYEKHKIMINDHAIRLKDIEDAISCTISDIWGSWMDPIRIHLQPPERVDVQDLIYTNNELFNKVITVFSVLSDEMNELKLTAESNFYYPLLMFGQSIDSDNFNSNNNNISNEELYIGKMLPFFQDLSNFIDRCNSITHNLINQLASLYNKTQKLYQTTFKNVILRPIFDGLANLLQILITIDYIIIDNTNITLAWDKYKRMMQYVRLDPIKYNMSIDNIKKFERLLVSLDQTIFSGQSFQTCIEQDFEENSFISNNNNNIPIDVRNNTIFLEQIYYNIKKRFEDQIELENTENKTNYTFRHHYINVREIIGTLGLYILYRRLLPPNIQPEESFYHSLWEYQIKKTCIILIGKIIFYIPDFLIKYAPLVTTKKLIPTDVIENRKDQLLNHIDVNFNNNIIEYRNELNNWLIKMESYMQPYIGILRSNNDPNLDSCHILSVRRNLIIYGILLANTIQENMQTMIYLHIILNIPIEKKNICPLYQCIEMLKSIEFMYARKNSIITESITIIKSQIGQSILSYYRPIKNKLEISKKIDDTKLDILASVTLIEDIICSSESFSFTRLIVLSLAIYISNIINNNNKDTNKDKNSLSFHIDLYDSKEMNNNDNIGNPFQMLSKLEIFCDYQNKIKKYTDCSFLYWNKELLITFLKDIYPRPEHAKRIQYILAGFIDSIYILNSIQHDPNMTINNSNKYILEYSKYIDTILEEYLVKILCQDIENDLRLHIHSVHLENMDAPNPENNVYFNILHYYLDLRPLKLIHKRLDLRMRVTHYLETIFYNLTTVALHDWKTYGEMRNLASDKYNLRLIDNYLPMGSLDQGLDILQIMRNIHIFTARYNYNLNQQFFIEKRLINNTNRHLNSINIFSIASSIRTHGMGILNTTINYTYQYLIKKFDIFSQFLFDEYIKSYLLREKRWFRLEKNKNNNKNNDNNNNSNNNLIYNSYPYDRAFQFNKEIRKLGISDTGKSFLDQFRILITEIGNALGYVRMVRSAGMNYCSNAIKFVPDLNNKEEIYFSKYSNINKLSDETNNATKNLDSVIHSLYKNFSENNDYFKILVKVFQDVLDIHLKDKKINNNTNDNKNNNENIPNNDNQSSIQVEHNLKIKEQKHLHNFYQILPSLTINFVETSVLAKDLMYKNSRKREAYFTDDGFSIGIAYILAILNQGEKFDALHWFEEVENKFNQDEENYKIKQKERENRKKETSSKNQNETTAAERIDDEEEIHALQMTGKRIEQQKREFDLLNWSLNGARIFFKY